MWLLIALIVAALVFGSLYLDNAGVVTPVKLVYKKEIINYKSKRLVESPALAGRRIPAAG